MISLQHFIFFLLNLHPLASARKPGCPARCGNITIPYPFGVGPPCSLESSFNIACNSSTTPPKPYLNISNENLEVVDIRSGNPAQIRIRYPYLLSGSCYNLTSLEETWSEHNDITLSGTQYTLSENNWLTTIGCDDFGSVSADRGDKAYPDACIAFCSEKGSGVGVCPNNGDSNSVGQGCCRLPIAKGTLFLGTGTSDLSKITNRTRLFPCSYAFVKEKGSINKPSHEYNLDTLQQSSAMLIDRIQRLQVVRLDWRIGDRNCSRARGNSTYVCQANSHCVDIGAEIGGYLCNCSQGYVGNPYLYPGCTDINECDNNPCAPHSHCKNIPGSYNCKCASGYVGDGKLEGSACTVLPLSNTIKIILIVLGTSMGLLLLLLLFLWLHKVFKKRNYTKLKEGLFKQLLLLHQQTGEGTFGKTKLFTAKELEKATDHFNQSRICGRGGQGIVYKGMLSDGTIVAIKKLNKVDEDQLEQFINEVVILSQINHKNVVKLLGCCLATQDPLLVYEFLPNGTLFDFIHVPKPEFPLTWNMRLKIATDVAGALAYLHFACSVPIYHRDIKSTNILLDEKYVVKVSDFGISKLVEVDQTHLTTAVKGTFGYLDPEYYQTSQYTEKSDVYSFGVVLLELLTGQRPISMERTEMRRNLAMHFLAHIGADNLEAILDAKVSEEGGKDEVIAVARLAQRCLNVRGQMRPTMKEVAMELESVVMSQTHPAKDMELEEETTVSEAKDIEFLGIEYSYTSHDHGIARSSSDAHPLMSTD